MAHKKHLELLKLGPGEWNTIVRNDTKLDLSGLAKDDFPGTLAGYIFNGVDLRGSDFSGMDLSDVSFRGANLTSAIFSKCNLSYADFFAANLTGANFSGASLECARFRRANMFRCILTGVDASGAGFSHALMASADLSSGNFEDADFEGASLVNANLMAGQFPYASFTDTNFSDADTHGARLALSRSLNQSQLDLANGDAETTINPKLVRPGYWHDDSDKMELQLHRIIQRNQQKLLFAKIERGILVIGDSESNEPEYDVSGVLETLRREGQEIVSRGSLSNLSPELATAINNYVACIPAEQGEIDQIKFGSEGVVLTNIADSFFGEISDEDEGALTAEVVGKLKSILALHAIAEAAMPVWQSLSRLTVNMRDNEATRQELLDLTNNFLDFAHDNRQYVSEQIIEEAQSVANGLEQAKPGFARVALLFLRDIFLSPFKYLASQVGRLAEKTADNLSDVFAKKLANSISNFLIVGGSAAIISYTPAFAPIKRMFEILAKLIGL